MTSSGALDGTSLSRAQARLYLLRFGGPLALVPSLLQPVVAVLAGVGLALLVRHPWPLLLPLAYLLLPLLWRRDTGRVVTPHDEPDLWALVGSVADALGAPLPQRLSIDASPNASFRRTGRTRRTELRLGVPLLVTLDRPTLEAVVAHELAHAMQLNERSGFGDAGLVERLVSARQRAVAQLAMRRRPGAAFRGGGLAARFVFDTQHLARALETDADRAAVAVVGSETLADALRAADRADAALALYRGFVVEPALVGGVRPESVLDGFTRWVAHVDARVLDRIAGWHDADPDSHYDDHPLDDERAPAPAELQRAVARHPSGGGHEPPADVPLHSVGAAEELLAAAVLGRHVSLPPARADESGHAIAAWRQGATKVRLALLRTGRLGRRTPTLAEAVARRTAPGQVPNESAGLVALLVLLAVSFAVELSDRGWLGPLPGTSVLISPAETYDDALAIALAALDEESIAPLVEALRAGRPRLTSA